MDFDIYEKEIELDKALLLMESCFELSDIAGISSVNHAKIQMFDEEFKDIDLDSIYEDAANESQKAEKKTGLIRKAIDKILDLIHSIQEKMAEKKQKADLEKIPDNQKVEVKKSTLTASKLLKKATNVIKKLLALIVKVAIGGAIVGALSALSYNLINSISSAMNKKTSVVSIPAKVVKGTVKDIGVVVKYTGKGLNSIKDNVKADMQSNQLNLIQKAISIIAGFIKAAEKIAFDMYFSVVTVSLQHIF